MLETKGLYKIYKPKKGVPVTVLKDPPAERYSDQHFDLWPPAGGIAPCGLPVGGGLGRLFPGSSDRRKASY